MSNRISPAPPTIYFGVIPVPSQLIPRIIFSHSPPGVILVNPGVVPVAPISQPDGTLKASSIVVAIDFECDCVAADEVSGSSSCNCGGE